MTEVAERLRQAAAVVFADSPVLFAYLYGSHAKGRPGARSDVDVAAFFESHDQATLDLALRLASQLERISGVGPVDPLLILNDAPIAVAGRVVQEGELIFSRDEPARVRHASLTLRQFHDFKIHETRSTRERLQRIAGGRHG
jgi:predicted nucleotidyltransferase